MKKQFGNITQKEFMQITDMNNMYDSLSIYEKYYVDNFYKEYNKYKKIYTDEILLPKARNDFNAIEQECIHILRNINYKDVFCNYEKLLEVIEYLKNNANAEEKKIVTKFYLKTT